MFKIGEFSKLTQVSIRMLRYYDETGLLKPEKTDKFTNYRLYSSDQINDLNKIKFLRDFGFNISEIRTALENWDNEYITNRLENKRREIEKIIKTEQDKLSKIELAKRDISKENIDIHYSVSIKSIPCYPVLSLRRIVPDYYAEGMLWEEMTRFAIENNVSVSSNTFAIYHDTDYREKDVDIEICALVNEMGENKSGFVYRYTEPLPIAAYTMIHGKFENIAGAFLSFASWLQEHNRYRMTGQTRQIVHRGPWNEECEDKYLIEIQIPLEDNREI